MKKEIKLILLDLDYTLLNSQRQIKPKTLESLKRCKEMGIMIGFSTSRGIPNIQEQRQIVEPDLIIASAGGCIYYKDELLCTSIFTMEETKQLFEATYAVFGDKIELTCDTLDKLYWNRKEDKSDQYSYASLTGDMIDAIVKICISGTMVTAEMRYDAELDYPLMYISDIEIR